MAPGSRSGRLTRVIARAAGALLAPLLLAAVIPGCGAGDESDDLLVLAAASLAEAFEALEPLAERAGLAPEFSFAGSPVVLGQVEQGAPADVVAVADARRLPDGVVFAENRMVLVGRPGGPVGEPHDLGRPGVRIVIAARGVPAGDYARQALEALGVLAEAEPNIVSEEADVTAVAARVALGEADAGIVYITDARSNPRLEVLFEPLPTTDTPRYAAAVAPGAPHPQAARRFLELLTSPEARDVLTDLGFLAPRRR